MKYGVKALAEVSGVTVRTLHFYDEVGLLKPAYYGPNGYRVYEEKQLLMLQQIRFFRELGFELKEIKRLVTRKDFDLEAALEEHRQILKGSLARTRKLIRTIDETLEHIRGERTMKDTEMFAGFDAKKQAEYEKQLVQRYGESMREGIAESKRRVKDWTKADWERSGREWDGICKGLVESMRKGLPESAKEVQSLVRQHFEWLKQFWIPDKESYAGHARFIVTSELRQAYDKYDPALAVFMAGAMEKFAEREL